MTPYAFRRFRQYDDEDEQLHDAPERGGGSAAGGFAHWYERAAALRATGLSRRRHREYDDECD